MDNNNNKYKKIINSKTQVKHINDVNDVNDVKDVKDTQMKKHIEKTKKKVNKLLTNSKTKSKPTFRSLLLLLETFVHLLR